MEKLPLIEGILEYLNENNISFAMPGHKSGTGFMETKVGNHFINDILKFDITEVDGVDNLHHPEGIIKEAQDMLSNYYNSKKSYFLVNGSTSGNLAMIFSAFNEGDKVIVERSCHRSIYNGIIMRKLKPVYVKNKIDERYSAPLFIDMEHFFYTIENNKDAKGIIVTYPNYYGICMDLEEIINRAKKYNMKVIVDCAHGAHFKASNKLPKDPLALGADMVVMSAHKTLPSLTQTAFLHVGQNMDTSLVDFYVSAFLSTSPSYLLMCSLDYGRYYLENYGKEGYETLIDRVEFYRNKINALPFLHMLDKEDLEYNMDMDLCRMVININKNYSSKSLYNHLRKSKIQCEMCDGENIVLIPTPFNYEEDFERLYSSLCSFPFENYKKQYVKVKLYDIPKEKLMPYEALSYEKEKIPYKNSKGRICKESVVPYPPGIPLVNPGEIIDDDVIKAIDYYVENNIEIMGLMEDKITVIR